MTFSLTYNLPLSPITGSRTIDAHSESAKSFAQVCRLTPEERSRLRRGLQLQIPGDGSDGLHSLCARRIAREQDIKVREVALLEASVEFVDLLGRRPGAFELLVAGMIAWTM